MQNTEQNVKVYNVLMLVKESMEMPGWNDRLSELTADVHKSLERTVYSEKAETSEKEKELEDEETPEREEIETPDKEETEQPEDEMDGFSME